MLLLATVSHCAGSSLTELYIVNVVCSKIKNRPTNVERLVDN